MTDTLAAPSWESEVLESVPRGFLAHDWQPATGGRTFEVRNPATEEVIACGARKVIAASQAAYWYWLMTPPRMRVRRSLRGAPSGGTGGASRASGGRWSRDLCGRWEL